MRFLTLLVLAALVLAGCADEPAPEEETDSLGSDQVEVDADTGAIRGVVVDQTITPIEGATVVVSGGGEEQSAETDADGLFVFNKLDPGAYFLTVSKSLYTEAQSSAQVEAGVKPDLVRIQIERLFDQDPYKETQEYQGFVGCAYNMFVSSTCVNDYTRILPVCGNGCAPQVTGIVDQREFQSSVGPGWQSIVWEMAWESTLSGTAEEMQITVSFADRIGASHWYTSGSMAQPYRLQCDVNTVCQEQQSGENGEQSISPDGQDDLWNMISAGDGNVALQQTIEVFQTNFYYAPSPDGWAILNGDGDPF